MQDNMKHNNIRIIGIPEGEEEQGIENLFEKDMTDKFLNLLKEKAIQVQEKQWDPIKRNPKRPIARHIIIKNGKIPTQREDLKGSKREKGSNIQGSRNKVSN